MTRQCSYAISAEPGRRIDITSPVRRILRRLGFVDLTEELAVDLAQALERLDVVILAVTSDPSYWRTSWVAEAVKSFRSSNRPSVIPMIVDDFVVVGRCEKDAEMSVLLHEADAEICNLHDPSIFARQAVTRIGKAIGRAVPMKRFERAARREHAREPQSCKDLIEFAQDQGQRNFLAAVVDILDVLLYSAVEDELVEDAKSFDWLFGVSRPLADLSAKIHLARLLDIISEEERDEIEVLGIIRNRFAHDFRLAAIGDDAVLVAKAMGLNLGVVDPARLADVERYKSEFPDACRNEQVMARIEASVDELLRRLRDRS